LFWSAPAERSGDGALHEVPKQSKAVSPDESGLPPHSIAAGSLPSKQSAKLVSLDGGDSAVALVIYTKPGCPYCQQARDYYNSKGITFLDRDAQTNREYRAEMFKYSGGDPTVPCIVQDGKYIQSGWGDPLRG
jgi:glutaredoxin 3